MVPYVCVAAVWIYVSDHLASALFRDPEVLVFWSTVKGLAFVAVTGALLCVLVARQVQRLRLVNESLERAAEARRVIEDGYRAQAALLDLAQDAILVRDLDDRVSYWNHGAATLFGWSADEVQGRALHEFFGPATPQFLAAKEELLRAGAWAGEMTIATKHGRLVEVNSRWTLVRDEAGRPRSVLVIATDVTETKRLEAQFLQAQKLECIGQLAGGVSHDYNNLLSATMLQVELLRQTPGLDEEVTGGLDELLTIAERGAGLTRQLLLFSRRDPVETRRVDLNDLVAGLVKMLRRLVGERIAIVLRPGGSPAWVNADPGMIEQVVMNLCVNARDAMPKGGELSIAIEPVDVPAGEGAGLTFDARPGAFVRLRVADTGVGMDEETMRRVFEPFFTTKGPGEGTGLGLATVSAIVRQHRGWVAVRSAPGEGSVFDVYLPNALEGEEQAARESRESSRRGSERILIVEDDPSVRKLAAEALARLGYRATVAGSGPEAIATWRDREGAFDLLVTDVALVGSMTGIELANHLRDLKPRLKVLIESGHWPDSGQAGEAGGTPYHFLRKPFGPADLAAAVRQVLDGASV